VCGVGCAAAGGAGTDINSSRWREAVDWLSERHGVLPALRAVNGNVVLINSGAGLNARPGWGPYAASKFALRAFADALRAEEPGLRVTSIYPGRTDTPMQQAIIADEGREYRPEEFLKPESVAAAVLAAVNATDDAHLTDVSVRPR
jgi:NADP-dependent 3-hydroxy acid dehydrogenase YdfG